MLVVASANGAVGMDAAWDVLARGGSALDAVEASTRLVEDNPDDHTVGYGGYPNLLGEVELDASIMDGTTRRAGAVAALKGYRHAITVARGVMDRLPHVVLVGEGAARFAAELGMQSEDLLTEEAERTWRDGLRGKADAGTVAERMLVQMASLATDPEKAGPERAGGTVNFIARDADGRLASAVSTSGWAWKYPGRAGDSPLVGAGNYCDDRYGAAACTGFGELAIRSGTARMVVANLAAGMPLADACTAAARDLYALDVPDVGMQFVAVDAGGNHIGITTSFPWRTYIYRAEGMPAAEELPRTQIPPSDGP